MHASHQLREGGGERERKKEREREKEGYCTTGILSEKSESSVNNFWIQGVVILFCLGCLDSLPHAGFASL